MKTRITTLFLALCLTLTLAGAGYAKEAAGAKKKAALKAAKTVTKKLVPQKTCPTCEKKIGKKVYLADVAGKRVYACSEGCSDKVKAHPAKALKALAAKGEKAETRLAICSKCGHVKGTASCCSPKNKKCGTCKLAKGAPLCCTPWAKYLALVHTDDAVADDFFTLCEKCGHIKGTKNCCVKGAEKCEKCGKSKGAPGCCYKVDFTALRPVVE